MENPGERITLSKYELLRFANTCTQIFSDIVFSESGGEPLRCNSVAFFSQIEEEYKHIRLTSHRQNFFIYLISIPISRRIINYFWKSKQGYLITTVHKLFLSHVIKILHKSGFNATATYNEERPSYPYLSIMFNRG